jgi:tetratricopeptide (TPR) repeat protein
MPVLKFNNRGRFIILHIILIALCLATKGQETNMANNQDSIYNHNIDSAKECYLKDSIHLSIYYINKALELQPKMLQAIGLRALFYSELPIFLDSAVQDYTTAIKLSNDDIFFYQKRAIVYYEMKRFNDCISDLNLVLIEDTLNTDLLFKRALANSYLKQWSECVKDLLKIIKIDKKTLTASDNIVDVYNNLGYAYLELGNFKKARVFLDEAMSSNQDRSYIWGSSGILNYKQGYYQKALSDFNKAINLYEKLKEERMNLQPDLMYYYRALILLKQHKNIESCASFTKAMELGNKEAKIQVARLCKK